MKTVVRFLKEVRGELARVEWPKTNEFLGSTLVVLVLVLMFAIFLGGVDRAITWSIKKILSSVL